jgi:hypothetical protein
MVNHMREPIFARWFACCSSVRWQQDGDKGPLTIKTISHYLIKIARLGGYLARANDAPPGNKVIWRGLSRLTSIEFAVASG